MRFPGSLFFEFAHLENMDGSPEDRTYFTVGSLVRRGSWHGAVNYSHRETRSLLPGMPDVNDHRFQATGGYEFGNGLLAEAGYHLIEEAAVTTHVIGFRLSYVLAFTLP